MCVKHGDLINLSEAASMEFVRQHTSIPVPKVHCAFERKGQTYIVMERIKAWHERSEESKAAILRQLSLMVKQMREIKSPHDMAVASVDGGSLYDMRLPGLGVRYPRNGCLTEQTPFRFGPFPDIQAFHRWLRRPAFENNGQYDPEVNELIAMHDKRDFDELVFTHGDLSSLNILVRDDKVVGLVDWETAGWYPAYWEFTTASQVNFRNTFWAGYVDRFLEPRPDDLNMDRIRLKWFGDT
ncbi:hypothetical protein LTR37_018230 [Vermiconidia calcicola]|uniref:Uncharacterized protein n=1 Tax=Vermiconidia calcicola TaxID=1690605 RepID=A0ACC3MHL0_9PEZI|nr:hypothetical protein LTR37_018230 [Vermiconidia calcicola]